MTLDTEPLSSFPCPVPERIIIYMDSSPDIGNAQLRLNDRELVESFERLRKIIRMFMTNKELTNCNGADFCQFAMMAELGGSASLLNGGDFLDVKAASDVLEQIRMKPREERATGGPPPTPTSTFDVGEAIMTVSRDIYIHKPETKALAGVGDHPPFYVTRLIMFVTRSRSPVKLEVSEELKTVLENPYFFVDVLYLHELPSDDNIVEVNWHILNSLNDLQQERGYMLECGPDVTDWHNASASLLTSPVLRQPFSESDVTRGKQGKMGTAEKGPHKHETMEVDEDCAIVGEKKSR